MKRIYKVKYITFFIIILLPILIWTGSFVVYLLTSLQGPDYQENIRESFRKLPSEVLIRKVKIYSFIFSNQPNLAMDVLIERKEIKALPMFIDIVEKKYSRYKDIAFKGLGRIKDKRAIMPLMAIILKGEEHPYYVNALTALAKMQYSKILDRIIERSGKKDAYKNESVRIIREFGDPKLIPLLISIKAKIPNNEFSTLNIGIVNEAIAHLESIQKQQEQQNKVKSPPTPIN